MKQFTIKALGLFVMLLTFGWVQAQNSAPVQVQQDPLKGFSNSPEGYDAAKSNWVASHPKDYEVMNPTAVQKVDAQALPWGAPENKDRWISENPRAYAEMVATPDDARTRMSKEQLATFPAEKQAAILKDANFIIID